MAFRQPKTRLLLRYAAFLLLGVGLVLLHALFLTDFINAWKRPELEVRLASSNPVIPSGPWSVPAQIPPGVGETLYIDGKVQSTPTPNLPSGMRHLSWRKTYQGGFVRSAGLTVLAGTPQTPEQLPCGARISMGQSLLDDGTNNPHTLANIVKRIANTQMKGTSVPVLGAFQEITSIEMWWSAKTEKDPAAVRILLSILFEKGEVPVSFWLMPTLQDGKLTLSRYASARVNGTGWFEKLASFVVRGDSFASDVAQEQLDLVGSLVEEFLQKPPPFPLGDGKFLQLAYCKGKQFEITEREAATIPLAVVPPAGAKIPAITLALPQSFPALSKAPLSLDVDLETLNGVLHFLWVNGYFEKALQEVGAKEWLNSKAKEYQFLTLRLGSIDLSLPPVVEPGVGEAPFSVGLEAAITLEDRGEKTPAKFFARLGLGIEAKNKSKIDASLSIEDTALTCEPSPNLLRPCYSDIFSELQRHTPEFSSPLATFLGDYLSELLRHLSLSDPSVPLRFDISDANIRSFKASKTRGLRLELMGGLQDQPGAF